MRHGSLFSGIGGFDLAAEWMGWENVFQVEKDSFCQKVLAKNFPNTARYGDIKEFDGTKYRGAVDIISGGFPCQPFSKSGKRKGKADDRYLWPEMLRIINEIKPVWIVGENVANLSIMELEHMLLEVESEGYKTETYTIPTCAVKGLHRRDRVWICAYSNQNAIRNNTGEIQSQARANEGTTQREYRQRGRAEFITVCNEQNWLEVTSRTCRNVDGLPNRMDRIGSLGNAIVPQVAFEIFKAIESIR